MRIGTAAEWSESASIMRQSRTVPPAHCWGMHSSSLLSIVNRASRRSTCLSWRRASQSTASHGWSGLVLPRLLDRFRERPLMLAGGGIMALAMALGIVARLPCPPSALVPDGDGLVAHPEPGRTVAVPLLPRRGPARGPCGAVRPVARRLARHLPAGRPRRQCLGARLELRPSRRNGRCGDDCGCPSMAM